MPSPQNTTAVLKRVLLLVPWFYSRCVEGVVAAQTGTKMITATGENTERYGTAEEAEDEA